MKNISLITVISCLLFIGCTNDDFFITGQGEITTQEIELEEFHSIAMSGSHEVIISKGTVQKITVTGYSNIIERLKRTVKYNVWDISLKNGNYKNGELIINITIPNTNGINLSGSGIILVNDFSSEEKVTIKNAGSGHIELNKNSGCKSLSISIDGSGKVYANKQFENLHQLNIDIDGSGNYYGPKNSTNICNVSINGSAQCNVFVNDYLNVKISGSGEVNFTGNPDIDSTISGSGRINDFN